jgi:hypothetical protein
MFITRSVILFFICARFFFEKVFDQFNNKYGVPFEKNEFLTFLVMFKKS